MTNIERVLLDIECSDLLVFTVATLIPSGMTRLVGPFADGVRLLVSELGISHETATILEERWSHVDFDDCVRRAYLEACLRRCLRLLSTIEVPDIESVQPGTIVVVGSSTASVPLEVWENLLLDVRPSNVADGPNQVVVLFGRGTSTESPAVLCGTQQVPAVRMREVDDRARFRVPVVDIERAVAAQRTSLMGHIMDEE